jgi:hypothetical protein
MSAEGSGDDHPREKNGSEQTVLETGYVADEDICDEVDLIDEQGEESRLHVIGRD